MIGGDRILRKAFWMVRAGHRRRRGAMDLAVGFGLLLAAACAAPPPPELVELAYPPPPEQPRYFYDRTLTGSRDVGEDSAADRFRRFATGEVERGLGFAKPFGIVAVNGRIYIGDTVTRRIAVLDFPAGRYFEFGDRGAGRLAKPLGLAADGEGRIYVSDGTSRRVLVYDGDGTYLRALGGEGMFDRPTGVAVNADGSRIYVVDTGGVESTAHQVRVFDGSGAHLFDIGARGSQDGAFNLPLLAAVGGDGRLHVVDAGNFRVQVFAPDGAFLFSFGGVGRRPGQFSHPKGIAVDEEGKIFVADSAFANVQIFDAQGQILMSLGDRGSTGGPADLMLPAGVAVDVDGRVYVVDQFFRKVEVFRPATLPAEVPPGGVLPAAS